LDGTEGLTDPEQIALRRAHVNQLVLTALDLNDQVHDTHHPIGARLYYEDQVNEAKSKALDVRTDRIPKILGHLALAIESNVEGEGKHLIGSKMTTADLVLFHLVDGMVYAFPKRMATMKADLKYRKVFDLHDEVAADGKIAAYLKSNRRLPYGMGVFRWGHFTGSYEISGLKTLSLGITRSLMPIKKTAGQYVCIRSGHKICPDVSK
jgi:glutathione S-transferase